MTGPSNSGPRAVVPVEPKHRRAMEWGAGLATGAAAAACYLSSLGCGLVFDDIAAVRDNRDVRPHTPLANLFRDDFWGTPLAKEQSHKSYRPLCVLTFRLNYTVHGLDPFGYHLVNVILHTAVCLLYYRVCMLYLPLLASFVAALLYAVHPIHTEAVTGVVGRAELLSALFYLSALYLYTTRRHLVKPEEMFRNVVGVTLLAALGMLCKEQALTVMVNCIVAECLELKVGDVRSVLHGAKVPASLRKPLRRVWLLVCATGVVLYLRIRIMGPHFPVFNRFDNPASVSPSPTRQLTYNYLASLNAWLLAFPSRLCCDWATGTVPLVRAWGDPRNLATLANYLCCGGLLAAGLRSRDPVHRKALLMGLSLTIAPYIPTANLLFPVGFVVAERVLYLPSMGFCILVGYGWTRLWAARPASRRIWVVGLTLLLICHSLKTHLRNKDWESELSLYSSALKVNQRNSKLFNNMGLALENLGRQSEALEYFREAIRVQPDCLRGYINLGRVLTSLRRYPEAENVYRQAKAIPLPPDKLLSSHVTPSYLQVYLNLATLIARNQSRLEEADALYKQAIRLRSDYTDAYLNRGDVLLKLNRTKEAEKMYEAAISLDNNNPNLYYNLGVVLMDQGRNDEALNLFNRALDIDPDHEKAMMNSAAIIETSGSTSQKQVLSDRLQRAVDQGKESEQLFYSLGLLALRNKNYTTAETCLKRALQIKPDLPGALFNVALLLSDLHRPYEALPYLTRLIRLHPHHIKGLVLLGDIYVNHLRDLDRAEECYRQILELEPGNQQGLHNLCVVYVERGELARAETCFLEASQRHPQAEYIRKHLEVTRALRLSQPQPLLPHQLSSS